MDYSFYKHTLDKQREWINIVKPTQLKRIRDILTPEQIELMINYTHALRYQVFFLVLYSMGLRLSEALDLTVNDIDRDAMQVHIREVKTVCSLYPNAHKIHYEANGQPILSCYHCICIGACYPIKILLI